MAVRIEVISATIGEVTVALYYPVPVGKQQPSAADPARTPAGTKLSAQEIQDLKDGKIIELVKTIDATGFTTVAMRQAVRDLWQGLAAQAQVEYDGKYRWKGDVWTDEPAWING